MNDRPADTALRAVILALLALFLFRTAWVGDDAYVTLRTIDHFVDGYGLVYNVGERAQAYTHPLWLIALLPVYVLVGHPWWTAVLAGSAFTLATAAFVTRRFVPAGATPLLVALPLSRAFVDYGTSGLENPLSHLLIAGLCASWLGTRDRVHRLSQVALWTGLLGLTRLDLLALAAPCLLAAAWDARWDLSTRDLVQRVLVGLWPLIVWEAFALLYYGSLLPTSAIAKLNTGLSGAVLAKQGLIYLLFQSEWDAVTLLVLIAGTIVPFATRDRRALPLAIGNLLWLAYVVRVGGDFMAGRFLTPPMLVALVLLARAPVEGPRAWGFAALLTAISLASPASTLRPGSEVPYGRLNDKGIVDERLYYASRGGDIGAIRNNTDDPTQTWRYWATREPPTHVQLDEPVGYPAFYAHPEVHWVSRYGIADPLLARLPPFRQIAWRVGHYDRKIPDGYLLSLRTGGNEISDPQVRRLYEEIRHINADPLLSGRRLRAIWRLNTGAVDVDPDRWRYPGAVVLPDGPPPTGSDDIDAPGRFIVADSGAVRRFPEPIHATALDLRRREDNAFVVVFERDGEPIASTPAPDGLPRNTKLAWTRVPVPARAARQGYDAVRVLPSGGPTPYIVHWLGPVED